MIAIVKIALQRPLTFIVMAIVILLLGIISAVTTPIDIFPNIRIPVVAVVWQYNGLPPSDMSARMITPYERTVMTTVNDIEHIESQSMPGIGVVKIFFQPGTDIRIATSQVTSISQTILRTFPPGSTPPLILNYNASTVPVIQLALSGKGLSEQQVFDLGQNQVRPQLSTIAGLAMPYPSGGKIRQIQVDINPAALQSKGLSAQAVTDAIAAQNQINPGGFAKIGSFQYSVWLNNAPQSIEALNDLPVKQVNGATIYMRDVAHVRDGAAPQTNIVHVDGHRSVLITVLKNGATSTLSIIQDVKDRLPKIEASLPGVKLITIGDQSVFVKAAVSSVVHEGVVAALLTALMILLFLGSWRSTLIVTTSIPLAVLSAIAALPLFGQTLNVMTLGGLALAVGILVDEATVTIESINYHLEQGKPVLDAIMDGAAQIVTPAFVSLLCICIVFVPMFFLPGVAGYLFVPLALSVVLAMIASFILSRTLVPTLAMYLLQPHRAHEASDQPNRLVAFQRRFETRFEQVRARYGALLTMAITRRRRFIPGFLAVVLVSFLLFPFLGRNFFPLIDAGQIQLHVRGPIGTRIEDNAARFQLIEQKIKSVIPADELLSMADNIGLPNSGINTVFSNNGTVGPQDGDVLITLASHHRPTAEYVDRLRRLLPAQFPGSTFAFLPADITSQILNFGAPAPIDVQVTGRSIDANLAYARALLRRVRTVPGVADVRIQQAASYPQIDINVDRTRIGQFGLTERDVTNAVSGSLAGTAQTAPVFFVNPENGVAYSVVAQTPEHLVSSFDDLANLPITAPGAEAQQLAGVAAIGRGSTPAVVSHYNVQPTVDLYAVAAGRDLGGVSHDIETAIADMPPPKGVTVTERGQFATMNTAFTGLGLGLLGAFVLIYLLIVVNFQSWLDPFVIITALPAAMAGIVWMLFITGTTLSVPALTGAIMCMGVATANSILVVSFARERLNATGDPVASAIEAGVVRFRPVLMTATAMIIGMAPMAIGWGEGGEQNAPLGRAVIGGLGVATIATLLFVPAVFALIHSRFPARDRKIEFSHA